MTELAVSHLSKTFVTHDRGRRVPLRAVDDVSFVLRSGHTVALVGESGSGKSTIARMLARLVRPTSGEIRLDGVPVPGGYRAVRRYRGTVQMIFQDPFASLNPTHTVGYHLRRPLRLHGVAEDRRAAQEATYGLLARVNLSPAELMAGKYPHELSGGQRQRVAIARALAPRPRVLLADEPVSMLDVSIRLEILNLIERLKREDDLAVLYVTHDLATARYFATEAMVMYRGQVVESGSSDDVILRPAHPYTRLLAGAAPDPTARRARTASRDLATAGSGSNGGSPNGGSPNDGPPNDGPPNDGASRGSSANGVAPNGGALNGGALNGGALNGGAGSRSGRPAPDGGCLFRNRCPHAMEVCRQPVPVFAVDATHTARCWLYRDADQEPAHAAGAPA